jgi:hypothetical protein
MEQRQRAIKLDAKFRRKSIVVSGNYSQKITKVIRYHEVSNDLLGTQKQARNPKSEASILAMTNYF